MKGIKTLIILFGIVLTSIFSFGARQSEFVSGCIDKVIFEGYDLNTNSSYDSISSTIKNIEHVTIELKLNYEPYFFNSTDVIKSAKSSEINLMKQKNRLEGALYHTIKNKNIWESLNLFDVRNIYISKYSPFIEFDVSSKTLLADESKFLRDLSVSDDIDKIYVQASNNQENKPLFAQSLGKINATTTWESGTYTGDSVKVGILECGIVDTDHSNFVGKSVTARKVWYYKETETPHATAVASIIGGINGLAPDVSIFSVELSGGASEEMDWLMDKQVDVINMSYGDSDPTGDYTSKSALMDYHVRTYGISIVAAAGNEGADTGYVGNPALGYNVVSVGASVTGLPMAISSYVASTETPKPLLIAPGSNIYIPSMPYIGSGTSLATPFVTAAVALLMEKSPYLKLRPDIVMTMLSVSCDVIAECDDWESYGYDDMVGAGHLNVGRLLSISQNMAYIVNDVNTANRVAFESNSIYLNAGDTLRACSAWLAYGTKNASGYLDCTDYDVQIINSNNQMVAYSSSVYSNIEMATFTATVAGNYKYRVMQYSTFVLPSNETSEKLSMSHAVIPAN